MNNGNDENANKKLSNSDEVDELDELIKKDRRNNSNIGDGAKKSDSPAPRGTVKNSGQTAKTNIVPQSSNSGSRGTAVQRPANRQSGLTAPGNSNSQNAPRRSPPAAKPPSPSSTSPSSPSSGGAMKQQRPSAQPPQSNKNIVADAKIREGFQQERTEIFNRLENDEQYRNRHRTVQKDPSDGSYRYAGKDIKSNRQKLVDVQPKAKPRSNYGGDRDIVVESKKRQKRADYAEHSEKEGFAMPSLLKVVLYVGAVILVSVVIAINMINIANDVFAFVKKPFEVSVTIPQEATIEEIADILSKSELIRYPKIFEFYANYRNKNEEYEFVAGEHSLSSVMNYDELVAKLKKSTNTLEEVRIAIPEGYTIDEIIDTFVAKGIGTRSGFVEVINNYEFDYRFVKLLDEAELSPDRKYRLEGYLFPDTYDFYKSSTEAQVIRKFLDNFNNKFTEEFYSRCDLMGMTVDEIINLASIIERETKSYDDFPTVSSVFHNRLNSPSFPRLESNATIQYSMGEHRADFLFMTAEDLQIDVPYNTYKYPGLPPSAICNPGYEAIYAALEPDITDYYYFVSKNDGTILYGRNSTEHANNIAIARSEE